MARLPRIPRKARAPPFAGDEELQSLASEVQGGHDAPRQSSGQTMWKVISLVLFGALILVLSTSVEFKVIQNGDQDMDSIPGHVVMKPNHDVAQESSGGVDLNTAGTTPKTADISAPAPAPDDAKEPLPAPQADNKEDDEPQADQGGNEPQAATPNPTAAPVPAPQQTPATTPRSDGDDGESSSTTSRITYTRRGQPMSDEDRKAMIDKWGSWTLVDEKERPSTDIYAKYPNRDIPRSELPPNAWQIDQEYLEKFLPEALAMVERTQKAILAEYGKTEGTWEERADMFRIDMHDDKLEDVKLPKDGGSNGGWTTNRSWDGLKRRILHAIMTEDAFIFAMGGHSAAAGHGNHFQQSYTLQVQWILEAVFARLGVRHQSRNFGNGGLGTIHNGLAATSVYGPDVDFLMWDSGMTEKEGQALDTFARQGVLGGAKVPVIWNLFPGVSQPLHDLADVDIGAAGTGYAGIDQLTDIKDLDKIPWAAQYVRCTGELSGICRENEYIGKCWIDRDDFAPSVEQKTPGGRAKWHPGNRKHQVTGRVLAFTILSALKDALTMWKEADGYVLSDDVWHVTDYYDNIRTKVAALPDDVGSCHKYDQLDLAFVCKYPVQCRTEFTPRAFPPLSNIRTLMPPDQAADIGESEKNIYDPPDVFNPALHPPPGEIDVLNIVENGVDFKSVLNPDYTAFYSKPTFSSAPKVPIGKGISLNAKPGDGFCDGSVDSFCNRGADNNCLLYGHNDGRHGLLFDGYSGWIILNIPNVKNGYVTIKLETWRGTNGVGRTKEWTSINNEERRSMRIANTTTTTPSRELKKPPPAYCDEFHFEFAIDGKITSFDLEQFQERRKQVQRVVETVSLLSDPNYTGGVEKEVEVAIRITGCAQTKTFHLTHVYWS